MAYYLDKSQDQKKIPQQFCVLSSCRRRRMPTFIIYLHFIQIHFGNPVKIKKEKKSTAYNWYNIVAVFCVSRFIKQLKIYDTMILHSTVARVIYLWLSAVYYCFLIGL